MILRSVCNQSLCRHWSSNNRAMTASTSILRCDKNDRRPFSSAPPHHHLARQNNSMVNVIVKSTKVPRPPSAIDNKTNIQLKKLSPTTTTTEDGKDERQEKGEEKIHSPSHFSYAGNAHMPITSELKIIIPGLDDTPSGVWPVFRMMVCNKYCILFLFR